MNISGKNCWAVLKTLGWHCIKSWLVLRNPWLPWESPIENWVNRIPIYSAQNYHVSPIYIDCPEMAETPIFRYQPWGAEIKSPAVKLVSTEVTQLPWAKNHLNISPMSNFFRRKKRWLGGFQNWTWGENSSFKTACNGKYEELPFAVYTHLTILCFSAHILCCHLILRF